MRDPDSVAIIVRALRLVHGDDIARIMLTNGMTLATLIDTLLHLRLNNRNTVRLVTGVLQSGDFIVTPDIGSPSHLAYVYDQPKSLHVVDVAVMTLASGRLASTDIRLRLPPY